MGMQEAEQVPSMDTIQTLTDIVSGHQIEKARIVSYASDNLGCTIENISDSLVMAKSTCYKHIDELRDSNIIVTTPIGRKKEAIICKDFVVTLAIQVKKQKELLNDNDKLRLQIKERQSEITKLQHHLELMIANTSNHFLQITVTPRNIVAYAATKKLPSALSFIQRHGYEKYAGFGRLYEEYRSGKTPSFLISKELGVMKFEVDVLIEDIENFVTKRK